MRRCEEFSIGITMENLPVAFSELQLFPAVCGVTKDFYLTALRHSYFGTLRHKNVIVIRSWSLP